MQRLPREPRSHSPYRPSPALGRGALLALVGCLLAVAGGCGVTQSPSATIEGARIVDRSDEAVRFDVTARLRNPNREDSLELRTVRYGVSIDGTGRFERQWAAQATLAPGSEAVLELPVVVPLDRLGPGRDTLDWSLDGALLYIAPGALAETLLDIGVRKPTIRFRGSGTVALAMDPPATLVPPAGDG